MCTCCGLEYHCLMYKFDLNFRHNTVIIRGKKRGWVLGELEQILSSAKAFGKLEHVLSSAAVILPGYLQRKIPACSC